jgi:hypothetical protein
MEIVSKQSQDQLLHPILVKPLNENKENTYSHFGSPKNVFL